MTCIVDDLESHSLCSFVAMVVQPRKSHSGSLAMRLKETCHALS